MPIHDNRRNFLRGLVSLPLIGGGVTLIGKPAAAVPLVQAAALPDLGSPRERARYAWEAFSAAMRDLTAGHHGWTVQGGEHAAYGYVEASRWVQPRIVDYLIGEEPRAPGLITERHDEVDLCGRFA